MKKMWILLFIPVQSLAIDVYFEKDDRLPLVHIMVASSVGAYADPRGKEGRTHLYGKMLLTGTKTKNREELHIALDRIGATINTITRDEFFIISGSVLAKNITPFLNLVREILLYPKFTKKEFRRARLEMISKNRRLLENDRYTAQRHFKRFLFEEHPYGKPIRGTETSIKKIELQDIRQLHPQIFNNQQTIVLGSGAAEAHTIWDWGEKIKPQLPGGTKTEAIPFPLVRYSSKLLIVDKPKRTQSTILIGQIGITAKHSSFFPLKIANAAFGGSTARARLNTEIREKRGWSYGAYSYFKIGKKPHSWIASLMPASQYTDKALQMTLKMIREFQETGLTQEEFDYSKTSLINNLAFMNNTPNNRMINRLLERLWSLPPGFMGRYRQSLEAVSFQAVNKSIREFFRPNQLSIVVLGTSKDILVPIVKSALLPKESISITQFDQDKNPR